MTKAEERRAVRQAAAVAAAHRVADRNAERIKVEKFRRELEAEHGTGGTIISDKLWYLAWEEGHSSGLHEVACYYDDLAELVKPLLDEIAELKNEI